VPHTSNNINAGISGDDTSLALRPLQANKGETSLAPTIRYCRTVASVIFLVSFVASGCATIRVTDPAQTATEQFLRNIASAKAIDQLSIEPLRDHKVYIDSTYLITVSQWPTEYSYLIGELRARLLLAGVRLAERREDAQITLEIRSQGCSIDRLEFLLGLPALYITGATGSSLGNNIPVAIPELAIVKTTRQRGYSSVAFVAYWNDTGELVASSGPFVGRTVREDFWFFGIGPRTVGNIPPAEQ
jgi:hypothetical protein